jgi:SAM-dependent methyltransferase
MSGGTVRPLRAGDLLDIEIATSCRGCDAEGLEIILSLGEMPLANALPTLERLNEREARYPLDVAFCARCGLVQLTASVPPEALFTEYPYFSSYSDAVVDNARRLVRRMIEERRLGPTNLAIEIASNDGYLLQHYARADVRVLGIDPAANIAPAAEARGVPTLCAFFGEELADDLRTAGYRADVLHAHNVLAHVPRLDDVLRGIARILADDGVAVIETPYVGDLVEALEFDTIYHEHLFYYSLTSLDAALRRNGLHAVDAERIPLHGGSLRVLVARGDAGAHSPAVDDLLASEARAGMASAAYYRGFAGRVATLCGELRDLLAGLKSRGSSIAAYGAAAKGATLLNAAELPDGTLEFVADRSPHKQGRYMPGVHLPIVAPDRLLEAMPEFLLLLAWNHAEEIVGQQAEYERRGGRFIVPVPVPHVMERRDV